jgi:hypothetical protein
MRKLLLSGFILLQLPAISQSPYLSVYVKIDSAEAAYAHFKIEMKICEPKNMTERGNIFGTDTSAIDFTSLKPGDITCREYIETEITAEGEPSGFNQFKFGNQVFAWEKILVLKISHKSSRGLPEDMYIVLPIRHKAFVTHIDLTGVIFESGQLLYVDDPKITYQKSSLTVTRSLKGYKTSYVRDSPLKTLLEAK